MEKFSEKRKNPRFDDTNVSRREVDNQSKNIVKVLSLVEMDRVDHRKVNLNHIPRPKIVKK